MTWLTAAQSGRSGGPPPTPENADYAATAFVPPKTIDTGLASFVVRVHDRTAWQSAASGGWLVVPNEGPQTVVVGSLVAVAEGRRVVGYFLVDEIADDERARSESGPGPTSATSRED